MKSIWKVLLLLFFISCTPDGNDEKPHNATELELERQALMSLFDSAGGDKWQSAYRNSWGRGDVSNLWRGVFVDEQGFVFKLDLNNINMQGTLPEELGNLKHLKQCNLNDNRLTGKIPQSLSKNENFSDFVFNIIRQQDVGFDLTDIEFKMPEFTYKDINGKSVKSDEAWAKNKLTVVFSFSADYDQPSQDLIAILKHLYDAYNAGDMGVIGFSNTSNQTLLDYCANGKISWTTIHDADSYFAKKLALDSAPSVMIVDQEGRVVLDDVKDSYYLKGYIEEQLGNASYYTSTDYSYDGQKFVIQQSQRPESANIVLMGDGFVDRDMVPGGKWEQAMTEATEHFFSVEPSKTYRDYFNVYAIKAVSQNEVFFADSKTAFSVSFGEGTLIKGNDDLCIKYLTEAGFDFVKTPVIMVVNSPVYAGTCYTFDNGGSIAYIPMTVKNPSISGDTDFRKVLLHEAVGHGFSRLLDEYRYYDGQITAKFRTDFLNTRDTYKMGYNMTIDKNEVPWQHFIGLSGYEMVSLYEGGYFFTKGVWRAEENHCMNDNVPYFNAPSRELFVKRLKSLIGENYDFSEFLANDKYEPVPVSRSLGRAKFTPLHPPVFVK